MKTLFHHSAEMKSLLNAAFARGADLCRDGDGFLFRVTLRSGVVFEGAPDHCGAEDVGGALALMSGEFILVSEIAAIAVNRVS